MNRRRFSVGLAAAGILLAAGSASAADGSSAVRIGLQKSSTLIGILKANGELEKALAPLGVTATRSEFQSGSPLLEALKEGAVHISGDVADSVPVFAQAAG